MQKAFEKITKKLEEKAERNAEKGYMTAYDVMKECVEIVNQAAEEYKDTTRTAWETIYRRLLEVIDEYAAVADIANVTDCKKLSNLLRHYKEQLTEEADSTSLGGWIPCSKRLPEIAGYEVLATLENAVGQRRVAIIFSSYGLQPFWHCNHNEFDLNNWKVLAWQSLPEPYKDCNICTNNTEPDELDNGCYMCCKGLENNYQPGIKTTNGDKIRSMSNKELAEYIPCPYDTAGESEEIMPCIKESGTKDFTSKETCYKCRLNYLKRECL